MMDSRNKLELVQQKYEAVSKTYIKIKSLQECQKANDRYSKLEIMYKNKDSETQTLNEKNAILLAKIEELSVKIKELQAEIENTPKVDPNLFEKAKIVEK